MKKISFLFIMALIMLPLCAQKNLVLTEGQPIFVYSLPKTVFCFDVEIEKTTQLPGQFYQYSQRYLATNDVLTEEKVAFRVKTITLRTTTIADPSRTYQVEAKNISNFLTVNSQGILCGVNVPVTTEKTLQKQNIKNDHVNQSSGFLIPLGEEFMMAGSTAKLAEGAAKQIYRIRESRMMLLGGDMDELPSDGNALKTMLEGLDRSEKELTSLFVGKTTVETQVHTIQLLPETAIDNKVLFRISAQRGLVDANDLGGAPYFISMIPESVNTQTPNPKAKLEKTAINTILPADTKVKVTDGAKTYLEKQLPVPQFGVLIPLSEKIFNTRNIKIEIDSNTGRLLSIQK